MKRRTSTAPVRVYSYGCRLPTANAELVETQILLAHRYYNTLIEIERRRREKVRAAQSESAPAVAAAEARVEVLSDAIEKCFAAVNARKGAARSADVDITTEKVALKHLREQRKQAIADMKAAKLAARTPELLAIFAAIGEEANEEVRQARARCGVYWGTYLLVEQAVQAARKNPADPVFQRWNGCGRVGVELIHGVAVPELFGDDTRLQISPPATTGSKRSQTMTRVRIRVGTEKDGRAPIFAEFPFRMHRPLPADGLVKWAWISKSLKGRWVNWDLQIVVEAESFRREPRPASDGGVIALDIGWRKRPEEDGTNLRMAYWLDDQGRRGELRVPSEIHETLKHAESIRSIEDKNFDAIRGRLLGWMKEHPLPAELSASLEYLAQWKAPRKLGRVVDAWKAMRCEGDGAIFDELTAWWKQHRHLYDWESCERDRTLGRRKALYLEWAADLTKRYAVIVLEDFNLREVAVLQPPDAEKKDLPKPVRRNRTVAACSEFRLALEHAAAKNGCTIDLEPCADTTATCAKCGNIERFDHRPLVHACERCGGESGPVDQDRNAAENLLASWSGKRDRSQTGSEDPEIMGALG